MSSRYALKDLTAFMAGMPVRVRSLDWVARPGERGTVVRAVRSKLSPGSYWLHVRFEDGEEQYYELDECTYDKSRLRNHE